MPPALSRSAKLAVFLTLGLISALYVWTATDGHWRFGTRGLPKNLITFQVEAFAAGQLSLLEKPDPALLALANPYDPALNEGSRLLDASLFEGKYYTYFGAVPLVAWFWPYFKLFGHHAPYDLTAALLAIGALLFQAAALVHGARQARAARPLGLIAGLSVLGLCNLLQPTIRRDGMFEQPVLFGIFFVSVALWALLRALIAPERKLGWFMLASLALGLAAGSRPNLFLLLPVPALVAWFGRREPGAFRAKLFFSAMAVAPAALIVAGLFAYNYARFRHPLEFGFTYQLVGTEWGAHSPFALRNLPFDLYYYLISIPRLSVYFPFFIESALPPFLPPVGHDPVEAVERVVGWLTGYPVLVVGALIAVAVAIREGRAQPRLALWLAIVSLCFGLVAGPLMIFAGVALRYQAEASVGLVLAASVGVCFCFAAGDGWMSRRVWRFGLGLLGVAAALLNFLVACETAGRFRSYNPRQYESVRQVADAVVSPVLRLTGWRPTYAALTLQFPARFGQLEPLWVHGDLPEADFLYAYYVSPGMIQFGFESMGRGGPVSAYIPLDYAKPHRLELVFGAFLPPEGHRVYRSLGLGDGAMVERLLRLDLDGVTVLDAQVEFHAGRERFAWGRSDREKAFGEKFTGPQFAVERVAFSPALVADYLNEPKKWATELTVKWPASAAERRDPLLVWGAKNRGQMVVAHFQSATVVRLELVDRNGAATESAPIAVVPGQTGRLKIELPSFASLMEQADPPVSDGRASIELDGREVMNVPCAFLPAGPRSLVLGRNTLLRAGVEENFSGEITRMDRAAVGAR